MGNGRYIRVRWNIAPETISLVILGIIWVYARKGSHLPSLKNRIFQECLTVTFAAMLSNILSTFMLCGYIPVPVWVTWAITTIYFILTPLMGLVYYLYAVSVLYEERPVSYTHLDFMRSTGANRGGKRIIVGATGASGLPILVKCLELIGEQPEYESYLIMSHSAVLTLGQETDLSAEQVEGLADHVLGPDEIGAGPASGSFAAEGMLIVPCSMKTIAGIHGGYAENLILRAADVTIKEQRTLVLAARETPLSPIHLRNMYELSMMPGVRIIPPMMTFYHRPENMEEMIYHIASRLLEPFGIEGKEYRRWTGL